jgi:hypothetical protein
MAEDHDISVHELGRQVRDVLARFQSLADRLDTAYTTKEMFSLYKILVDQALSTLQEKVSELDRDKSESSTYSALEKRIHDLEDNQKWIVRLIVSLVVVALVGGVIITGGGK